MQTRGPPITPTSTLDIMLGHTSSHMLIARTYGPMKKLEEALGTVPVEGPARGAFVHPHAVKMHALTWHTYPAHDGAAAPKLARPLVDKHLHSHTCLVHPRLRYREPQVHGWGGGCGTRRAQIDAWSITDIIAITPASLAWAPQPVDERNCKRHAMRTASTRAQNEVIAGQLTRVRTRCKALAAVAPCQAAAKPSMAAGGDAIA